MFSVVAWANLSGKQAGSVAVKGQLRQSFIAYLLPSGSALSSSQTVWLTVC